MPDQNQPNPNINSQQPNSPAAQQPAVTPPVIFPQSSLPPLPPAFQNLSEPKESTTPAPANQPVPAAAPIDQTVIPPVNGDTGSAAPPDISSVAPKPKKKFGSGKIIATILGFVVLVGGVGAGIILTQQQQLLQPKAFTSGVRHDTCNLVEVTASDNNCPILESGSGDKNNVSTYTTHYTVKNITGDQHVISIDKHSNYCTEPYGVPCGSNCSNGDQTVPICSSNPNDESSEITLAGGQSTDLIIPRVSSSGKSCGSYQTDLIINSIDGNTNCTGGHQDNLISGGVCQTGSTCQSTTPSASPTPTPTPTPAPKCNSACNANTPCPSGLVCASVTHTCPPGEPCPNDVGLFCRNPSCKDSADCLCPTNSPTPTPSSSPTATPGAQQCLNIKIYNTSWTVLSDSDLSNLLTGAQVNFCVSASGSPDKAQFMINGTLEPETKSVRSGSTDFCQTYTISSTDITVSVKAKIHYSGQGWFGEDM